MNTTPRSRWFRPRRPFHPFGRGLFMLLSALLLPLPVPALAAPGDLDPSFDGDGKVLTDFRGLERVDAVVVQPNRKLVVAGFAFVGQAANVPAFVGFALARYNPDGSLDRSFGGDGRVRTRFRSFGDAAPASALVLQPDGKLVAAGLAFLGSTAEFPLAFALARYNPDGNLDTSFGTGGFVLTDFGGTESARALVLQPDGKLVTAGESNEDFALARYNPNGSIDTSFGTGGVALTRFRGGSAFGGALSLSPDGKLLAAGSSNASGDGDFALARYLTSNEPLAVPPKCGGRRATILGTERRDTIRGTRGPDVILGLGGNDTIRGLQGNDTICGGPGLDTLIGNDGQDRLLGEDGDDKLFGDKGRDRLDGGSGRDACRTGETARRCEGQAASGERPKDPPKPPPCPPVGNFPCS